MKVLTGHLTQDEKKAIKAILSAGLDCGKVGKTSYYISSQENVFTVKTKKIDRGLIPCPGSPLRVSTYSATFTI